MRRLLMAFTVSVHTTLPDKTTATGKVALTES
jgi:hypothetical protein